MDFVLGDAEVAIEAKGKRRVHDGDTRHLQQFRREHPGVRDLIMVCLEERPRVTEESARPQLLGEEIAALGWEKGNQPAPVVIDEVQKLPELLDEVHRLHSLRGWRFILSGSSARKLRRGGGNLLGGRAVRRELLPLTYREIPDFSLERALNHGLLPSHYLDDEPEEAVAAYVGTYLKEGILAESLVLLRHLPGERSYGTRTYVAGLVGLWLRL